MGRADDAGGGLRFESVISAYSVQEERAESREMVILCLGEGETVCPNGVSCSGLSQRASDAPSSYTAIACGGLFSSLHASTLSIFPWGYAETNGRTVGKRCSHFSLFPFRRRKCRSPASARQSRAKPTFSLAGGYPWRMLRMDRCGDENEMLQLHTRCANYTCNTR